MNVSICIHYLRHRTILLLLIVRHFSMKLSTKDFYMQEVSKNFRTLYSDCKETLRHSVLPSSPHEQQVCCEDQSFYLVSTASV